MSELSIIIPIYQTGKYLSKCVDSVLSQTFTDFELILVDDGSTDYSGKICDEYAAKDSRIKVIHKQNEGVSVARNTGTPMQKSLTLHIASIRTLLCGMQKPFMPIRNLSLIP